MTLTAVLPLAIKPEARRVAVIGIGNASPRTRCLEISIWSGGYHRDRARDGEAARLIRPRNTAASPIRAAISTSRRKTYFSTHNRRYDVTSRDRRTRWVSGVSSLFTLEFYRLARRHLARDGVLVRGSSSTRLDGLLASVIAALSLVFPDYVIYTTNDKDLLIFAGESAVLDRPLADVFRMPALAKELKTVQVHTLGDLDTRRLGGKRALEPLFQSYGVPANSDYYPYLDLHAPRLRFLKREATDILALGSEHAALVALFDNAPPQRPSSALGGTDYAKMEDIRKARYAAAFLLSATPPEPVNIPHSLQKDPSSFRCGCCAARDRRYDSWLHALYQLGLATTPYLSAGEASALWDKLAASRCVAALPPEQRRWVVLLKAVAERDAAMMAAAGEELLAAPAAGLASAASRHYLLRWRGGLLARGEHGKARTCGRYEREIKSERRHPSARMRRHRGPVLRRADLSDIASRCISCISHQRRAVWMRARNG